MATLTLNYNLVKPAQEDFYNVDDQNRNMDTIDKTMKALADDLTKRASLGPDGKVQPDQLPAGSDPSEAIRSAVDTHNSNKGSHKDIRDEVAAAAKTAGTAQETAEAALNSVSDLLYTVSVVPSQRGSLAYNGQAQSPAWNAYNPEALTLGGVTTGTNAGEYQATFTPKGKYKWTDGTQNPKQVTWKIDRASIAVPSQSGSLTYNGSPQTPTWTGYDSGKMTLGGTTTGTNAGSYNAAFTPDTNYKWTDGATTAKTVAWTIGKATGSLTLSKFNMSLNASKMTDTITVTRPGTGAISAISNASGVASVSVSGNVVTVTAKAKGSATITISVAADTNYTAPASKTCSVTVTLPTNTLNDNDWDTIKSVSDAGKGSSYWAVGDVKSIQINGRVGNTNFSNLTINTFILGFNHNSSREGNNKIHFQIGKIGTTAVALCDAQYSNNQSGNGYFNMNPNNSNANGWKESYMRKTLLGNTGTPTSPPANTLLAALPSALRNVMKPVTKYTDNTATRQAILRLPIITPAPPPRCGGGCVPLFTATAITSALSTATAASTIATLTTRLVCGPALLSNPPQDDPGPIPPPQGGEQLG